MIRDIVTLGVKSLEIIRKEGLRSFYFRANLRINSEKKPIWTKFSCNSICQEAEIDIIIPVFNAYEDLKRCIESVLATTSDTNCNVIIINDKSTDPRILSYLKYLKKNLKNVNIINNNKNIGFVKTVNKGLRLSNKDVIILNSDTIVTKDWLKDMISCAMSDSKIATVTPLSNNATIYSVPGPEGCNEIPYGITIQEFADLVKKASQKLSINWIKVPTAVGFCMLIKRSVIQNIGFLDEKYGQGYNEENDFCMRASARGFIHACCTKVFIYHRGNASFKESKTIFDYENSKILNNRYPQYRCLIDDFVIENPLAELRDEIKFLSDFNSGFHPVIGIDCQLLNRDRWTGSERSIFFLVESLLGLEKDTRYVIYTKNDILDINLQANRMRKLVNDSVGVLLDSENIDILHRPIQCFTVNDLLLLLKSRSSIITILDLILYNNPSYFYSRKEASLYRDIMRLSTKFADKIIVISNHVKKEVIEVLKVPEDKIEVVYLSADKKFRPIRDEQLLEDCINKYKISKGYILLIGTDFPHKNIDRSIIAYKKFEKNSTTPPQLVIVGPSTSSRRRNEINRLIDQDPNIKILDYINDDDIANIYNCAGFLLYPTLYEGFGLPILEAMSCGVPVVASNLTSIPEIAADAALLIDTTNVDAICEAMIRITTDNSLRQTLIDRGFKRAKDFSWHKTAKRTFDIYMNVYKNQMKFKDKLDSESIEFIKDILNHQTSEWEKLLIADLLNKRLGKKIF